MNFNAFGRSYCKGTSLSLDLRELVIKKILELGGNKESMIVPHGVKAFVAEHYSVTEGCVRKLWRQYCMSDELKPKSTAGFPRTFRRILEEEDVDYIHCLKMRDPCMYNYEVLQLVQTHTNNPSARDVSISTIQRTTRKRLPGGLFTWKKVNSSEKRRWEEHNMLYTKAFFQRLRNVDPRCVFFVDEAGVSRQSGKRTRGQSSIGSRAVSITDHVQGVNYTLILLVGLGGCIYSEITPAKVDALRFVQFITSAHLAALPDGRPVLPANSIIVLDNASIHVSLANNIIRPYFRGFGISYIYLPTYSPDFSPAEACFMKLKTTLRKECYRDLLLDDPQTCVLLALTEITDSDIHGFYRNVPFNYLGM